MTSGFNAKATTRTASVARLGLALWDNARLLAGAAHGCDDTDARRTTLTQPMAGPPWRGLLIGACAFWMTPTHAAICTVNIAESSI